MPIPGLDERALDRARISRDPRFDGRFFIAVTSTGIYCRPICPVRSPKPSNIRYYPTAAAAAQAGFRPCLRCRPEVAPASPAWSGTSAVVVRALRLIEAGALDGDSVETFAGRLGIGARHLHRLFVEHVGAPPTVVARTHRLHFARRLLDETMLPIAQVGLAAGFGSVRRFNSAFRGTYGRPPRDVRRHRRIVRSGSAGRDVTLRLAVRPPYDWESLLAFLAARAIAGVERVDNGGYSRTVRTASGAGMIHMSPVEGANALELRVQGAAPADLLDIAATARRMFDLAADPVRIAAVFRSDALLSRLAKRRRGLRIPGVWDPFECLVRAIVGQQVSVAAGRTFVGRLVGRAGVPVEQPAPGLTHLFPTPEAIASADLSGIGLTSARVATLRAAAAALAAGTLDFTAAFDDVRAALVALPGVGAWTAEYVALRALGDPDAFPAGDLVLRRAAAGSGRPLATRALLERADAWRPWRGYAALHLWASAHAAADR